ncbi:MAG: hypothetical protein CBC22_03960 [Alphaproteobacteria bacterium TMED62]|nr:MAG: hypothetical protein CBC22_03960 [Alphaproteobacteria bacterium TMED62]|tara:strand:+ start:2781 stop:3824 length:1044 start_codon:yes stop_codon:yes gene_type:complete
MINIKIKHINISETNPPPLIAEIGINHGGSLKVAKRMAKLAITNGADIVKHQSHIIDDEMSEEADAFKVSYIDQSIYNIMKRCALSMDDEAKLKNYVEKDLKAVFISTPFSRAAANFLYELDVPAFKIGSGECNNYPLVEHIAKFKKPIILSTGMNDVKSISKSVNIINKFKAPLVIMHTTNSYPCPDESINLNCIKTLQLFFKNKFHIGFSDHSVGEIAIQSSVLLGARILEKHFTDSLKRPGPDIECSMDPKMCKVISKNIKRIFLMRKSIKELQSVEKEVSKFAFASVCTTTSIKKGEKLTKKNIWVKRPGTGDYLADSYNSLLNKTVKNNIKPNTQIKKKDIK